MSSDFKENGATLGHCLCHTISLAIPLTAEPSLSFICHYCGCQRNAGGPYQVVVIFSSSSVRISDPDKVLKEHIIPGSATLSRCSKVKAFCSRCGCTPSIAAMKWGGEKTFVRTVLLVRTWESGRRLRSGSWNVGPHGSGQQKGLESLRWVGVLGCEELGMRVKSSSAPWGY